MKDEKNIENIFREKLENFQATPPPHIWDNVQLQLAGRRRKARLVYMGWISAAAVIVLAFLAGWYFTGNQNNNELNIVESEIIKTEKSVNETKVLNAETAVENSSLAELKTEDANKSDQNIPIQLSKDLPVVSKETSVKKTGMELNTFKRSAVNFGKIQGIKAQVAQNQFYNAEFVHRRTGIQKNSLSEYETRLVAENTKNLRESSKPEDKWLIGMFVAPGYSSYSSSYSETYARNMNYTGSSGNANVGGGFSVQYKTSKRFIVESGIYYAQNGQQSENSNIIFARNENADYALADGSLPYFTNQVQVQNNNIAMNSAAGVIQFNGTPKGAELTGDFEAKNTGVTNLVVPNGEFSQVFDFMEIPLYLRYRVVDRKIGVELLTGFNTGIVVGNNAYIENQYGVQNIGETADISTFNISGTLGVGLNYALGDHISVAVEPRFNYYLNSINSNPAVEFRPYRMGFYTGITYEF